MIVKFAALLVNKRDRKLSISKAVIVRLCRILSKNDSVWRSAVGDSKGGISFWPQDEVRAGEAASGASLRASPHKTERSPRFSAESLG